VAGNDETEGPQKACGSKASGTLRYRLCVDGWMSSTDDASGVCQLRLRRTEIPPSPGKRIYPVPPVPPPAGFWVWREGEESRFAERAERGGRRKAARCSTRCGEAADCSENRPNRNREHPQGHTAGNVFGPVQLGKAPEIRAAVMVAAEREFEKKTGRTVGRLKLRGNGRWLSVLRRSRDPARGVYFYFLFSLVAFVDGSNG
jgi:hypothetical protein